MTPTTLQTVGRALYGPCWQREMARQLDVSDRTVNRWATGVHAIPEGVRDDLKRLCLGKAQELRLIAMEQLCPSTNTDTKKDASDRHREALRRVPESPVVWNDNLGEKSDD